MSQIFQDGERVGIRLDRLKANGWSEKYSHIRGTVLRHKAMISGYGYIVDVKWDEANPWSTFDNLGLHYESFLVRYEPETSIVAGARAYVEKELN